MNNFNWDGLRYFIAAAEGGSLTAAAKRMGSNQPTVGRYVDALEKQLEVRLFQRSVKGLTLTEEGVALLEQCQEIQSQMIKIAHSISDHEDINGTVRIALPEGLCLEVLVPQLEHFYREYPEIRLILNVSSNSANLTRGEADIALRLFRPSGSNLVARRLGQMNMGLYAARHYLDNFGTPGRREELVRHHIISYGDRLATLEENRWLLESAAPTSPVLCSDSTATRLAATLAGVGISIQPQLIGCNHPQLMPLLQGEKISGHEMWLVYHHDLRQVARVRAVANFIYATFTEES